MKRFPAVAAVLMLLGSFSTVELHAQTTKYQTPLLWCSQDIFNTSEQLPVKKVFNWPGHFVKLNRVGTIYMPNFGTSPTKGNSMSRPYWADANLADGHPWAAPGWDETWYMPAEAATGRSTLWRLWNNVKQDHMDSESQTEGASVGYVSEGPVGFPWTATATGRKALARYFSTNFDHRTERPGLTLSSTNGDGQIMTYGQEFQWDGTSRPAMYAYLRNGTRYNTMNWPNDGRCAVLRNPATFQNTLDNNTIKIEFNRDWGNAIQRIFFDGRQIVSGHDIGAMMQTCLWVDAGHGGSDPNYLMNPTEAGGEDTFNGANTFRWAGSPVTSVTTGPAFNPNSPAPITLTTTLRPLNFASNPFYVSNTNETTATQPLMWRGTFSRPTTVGYQSSAGYLNNVIKMGFGAQLDNDVTDTLWYQNAHLNPTFWLYLHNFGSNGTATTPASDAKTNIRYVWYNTATKTSSAVYSGTGELTKSGADTTNVAMIAYSAQANFAVGILSQRAINGQIFRYQLAVSCPDCPHDEAMIVLNINDFQDMRDFAMHNSDSYFVVGTLTAVKDSLRKIYCKETGSCVL